MPDEPVTTVEGLRIHAVQPAHATAEIRLRRCHQQVVVIPHQAIGVKQPPLLRDLPTQEIEKPLPVFAVPEDHFAPVATRSHVVQRANEFQPHWSCHRARLILAGYKVSDPLTALSPPSRTLLGIETHNWPDTFWAIEIKHGLTARPGKGFYIARDDLEPERCFVVYSGAERYPLDPGVEAIGLRTLAGEIAAL